MSHQQPPRKASELSPPEPSRRPLTASRGGGDGVWRAGTSADETLARLQEALTALATIDRGSPAAAAARAAEGAIREAAVSQDRFLHAAAHDLRNPLAAIRGQVQLLQRRARRFDVTPAEADRIEESLRSVDAAVGRTTALVDRLLDTSWHELGAAGSESEGT